MYVYIDLNGKIIYVKLLIYHFSAEVCMYIVLEATFSCQSYHFLVWRISDELFSSQICLGDEV